MPIVRLVSPLSRVIGLGSAKEGVGHWWAQRLTAVALVPLGLWLAWSLAVLPELSYATVVAWAGAPWTTILLTLTVIVLAYHSYLGVEVVVEDYVQSGASKLVTLVLSIFAHALLAVSGVYAVLRIGFGA